MRAADWKRLAKPALQQPGWRFEKTLAYRAPVGWILHGLLAEKSHSNPAAFYLWLVQMPLVVPTDVIDLNWSERYGGGTRTFEPAAAATEHDLKRAAEIVAGRTRDGFVVDPPGGGDNMRMQEARAYGLLLAGDVGGAIEVLGRVSRSQPRYDWGRQIAERAEQMRSLLVLEQIDEVVQRVAGWRSESLSVLGLVGDEMPPPTNP